MEKVFKIVKNVHTDLSVQWDVYQNGSDQRLASAATELEAITLVAMLSETLEWWCGRHGNSVDA